MSGEPENSMVDTKICYYSEDNDTNLLFDLDYMAVILDFTHNAMSVSSGHTIMLGDPENLMIDTKITNLQLFSRKCYQFIV